MKLRELTLHNFGHFDKREFSFGDSSFVLIYGPNESGKSTFLQGFRESLFGFSPNAYSLGGEMAADVVALLLDGTPLQFRRRRGRKRIVEGTMGSDSIPIDETMLAEKIGALDALSYANLFGFSLRELAQGEASLKGSSLTEALLGNSQSNAVDWKSVRRKLQNDRDEILTQRGRNQRIPELVRSLRDNQSRLEQDTIKPRVYRELRWEFDQTKNVHESVRRQRDQLALDLRNANRQVEAWPILFRIENLRKRLHQDPLPSKLTSEWANRWRSNQSAVAGIKAELHGIDQELSSLNSQIKNIPQSNPILDRLESLRLLCASIQSQQDNAQKLATVENRIEYLVQQRSALESAISEVQPIGIGSLSILKQELREFWTPLQNELRELERLTQESGKLQEALEHCKNNISNRSDFAPQVHLEFNLDQLNAAYHEFQSSLLEWSELEAARMDCERLQKTVQGRRENNAPMTWDSLPSESDIDSSMKEIDRWNQHRQELYRERQQIERDRLLSENSLEEVDSQGALPSYQEMENLRKQRDQLLDELRGLDANLDDHQELPLFSSVRIDSSEAIQEDSTSDLGTEPSFISMRQPHSTRKPKNSKRPAVYQKLRTVTVALDSMVTRMLSEAQRFAKRDQILRVIEEYHKRELLLERQITEIEAQCTTCETQWKNRWKSLGIVADSLESVKQWVVDVRQWRALTGQITLARQRLDNTIDGLDLVCSETERKVGIAIPVERDNVQSSRLGAYFAERVQSIRDQYEILLRTRSQVESWQDMQVRALADLTQNGKLLSESNQRKDGFEKAYQDWLRRLSLPIESQASRVEILIDQWIDLQKLDSEIVALRSEQGLLKQRILEFMIASDSFHSEFSSLPPTRDVQMRCQELLEWRGRAEVAANENQQMQGLLIRSEEKKSVQRSKHSQMNALLEEQNRMLSELEESDSVKVDNWTALAKEYWDQLASISSLEDQLRLILGVEDYLSAIGDLLSNDLETYQTEAERLKSEVNRLEEEMQELSKKLGRLEQQLKDIEREDNAEKLCLDRQDLFAQLEKNAEQWMIFSIADILLESAVDAFRKQQQTGVLEDVVKLFAELTCGAYVDVRSDIMDPTRFLVVDKSGEPKTPEQLSTGTREQLYLSIRLAYVEHYCRSHEPLPLVLDDCFVNFDDQRLESTLKVLQQQKSVQQSILLSCHERTVNVVKAIIPDALVLTL